MRHLKSMTAAAIIAAALILAAALTAATAAPAEAPASAASPAPAPAPVAAREPAPARPVVQAQPAQPAPLDMARAVERAIEAAAERVGPAVVNILVTRESTGGGPIATPEDLPEDLREFFDRFHRGPMIPYRAQGNGSGFLISADGFILTSEHVVRDASQIEVTLSTRKRYPATIVGSDPRRDLAVIRIEAKGLPVAPLGDAATLHRGQFVLALGSPFGFGRDGQASLSFGIVSGTGRAIPGIGRELDRYYGNLIQTDAAVNPGNSGGPLVTLDGEVVGINAVISSQSGTSDGVGFAVPMTGQTRGVVERLKRGEKIAYGFIGVEIQEVDAERAAESKAEAGDGAYVGRVLADGPGAKGGVKEGDVIVDIGGSPVHGPDDVIRLVQATPVGEKLAVTVMRGGQKTILTVVAAQRPAPREVAAALDTGTWWRGMRVEPLTQDLREQIGLEAKDQGVFVREVRDASPAAEAGLSPGMVVDQVGETKVATVDEFRAAAAGAKGPAFVHVAGIGVKVIQAPGKTVEKEPKE
jgi:serine protease Do